MGLIEHLESQLGPIQVGWSALEDGRKAPFWVVRMSDSPVPGTGVLVTLGLGRHPLAIAGREGFVRRQELMMMYRLEEGPQNLPVILQDLGMEALHRNAAYDIGQVVGPRGPLRDGATVEALYVALPAYFEDSFCVVHDGTAQIVIGWVIPITVEEAAFVREHGREKFEDILEAAQPELWDLARKSLA